MDIKLGLTLVVFLTAVSSEECLINSVDSCIKNIQCKKTLDGLKNIETDSCKDDANLKITLEIENVDDSILSELNSLNDKVLKSIVHFKLTNGQNTLVVPAAIRKMNQLISIDLSNNKLKKFNIDDVANPGMLTINLGNNEINELVVSTSDISVVSFNLTNNNINKIPDNYFQKFIKLRKLDLSRNHIQEINIQKIVTKTLDILNIASNNISKLEVEKDFVLDNVLKEIDLGNNQINAIPDYFFKTFGELEDLDLSNNTIEKIDVSIFVNLKKLKHLDFSNNKLKTIDHVLYTLESLEILKLRNNLINSIDRGAFKTNLKLKNLDLGSNKLTDEITSTLEPLQKLSFLDLSYNNLTEVNENSFKQNINLKELNLSNNQIQIIKSGAFKGKHINKFSFKNNQLKGALEKSMFEGLFPKELDLSHGNITEIGESCFSAMSSLETLLLNNNHIQKVDATAFEKNSALQTLDISHNNLEKFSIKTGDLKNLINLSISHNEIRECEAEVFKNLAKLQELNISNNKIEKLEADTFKTLLNLEKIDLHKNPIEEVNSNCFNGLKNLKKLYIQETNLKSINDGLFSGMTNLEYLNAAYAHIITFSKNALKDNKKIKELYLNNNKIKDITNILNGLTDLNILNLAENEIDSVSLATFSSLQKLISIDMSNNVNLFLDEHFKTLSSLEKVNLHNTKGADFTTASSVIKELDLSSCHISDIDSIHINNLKKLEKLNLCENSLSKIDTSNFKGMTLLTHMKLCNNTINFVEPTSFTDLKQLKEFDLSGNKLSKLSYGTFKNLESVKKLDLSHNELSTFTPGHMPQKLSDCTVFLDYNKITELDFDDFVAQGVTTLSIGNNLIPCEDIKKASSNEKITLTAKHLYENAEITNNVNKIACFIVTTPDSVSNLKPDGTSPVNEASDNQYESINKSIANLTQVVANQTQQLQKDTKQFNKNDEDVLNTINDVKIRQHKLFVIHNSLNKTFEMHDSKSQGDHKTLKTLGYISAIGVMVVITILVVKCIITHYKKSQIK